MIWTLKKCNKKLGSPCLFTRQQVLKMGYFYWLCVKNWNHLHTELSLVYFKDTNIYFENKASFIHISSIASLRRFWFPGCGNSALFGTVPWLAWSPRLGQNTPSTELFSKKIRVLLSNFFSSSNMFFIRQFLANTWKKNRGSPCSFERKGAVISLSGLVWGKSLTFCTFCAHVCALMTRKSCAVGMRNAILRNHLNCNHINLYVYM